MLTRWQIVKSDEKKCFLLFFDGTKTDAGFIYRKIAPFVKSARYAQKPYNYCFFLENIDASKIDEVKKVMAVFAEITQKTDKPHNFQEEKEDFFTKLQKGILNLTKLKSEKYTGENETKNPRDMGIEIEKPANWQVVDGKQKADIKSEDFFNKLQNQLINLGKNTLEEVPKNEQRETKEEKPALDFGFLEKFFAKPKPPVQETSKPPEKTETPKEPEKKITEEKSPEKVSPAKSEKETPVKDYPKRFEFKHSKKLEFSAFAPINPIKDFDSFEVTSGNKNPYALSVSVAQNPGAYDIPFTITGAEESGKTHLLTAIYNVMKNQFGPDKILFTTGHRFSKTAAADAQNMTVLLGRKLEDFDALLIDNVHNMLITDGNKNVLDAFFENCRKEKKQIVFTSKFGREKLESMFSDMGFKLPLLSIVELKPPVGDELKAIEEKYISAMGFTDEQKAALLYEKNFTPSFKDIKRLWILKILAENFPKEPVKILNLIKNSGNNLEVLNQKELGKVSLFKMPDENIWGRWGVFYHKGSENYAKYVLYKTYETAKNLGVAGGWENVFLQPYDKADTVFFPARMTEYAFKENVNGIIVIGPSPEHSFFKQTSEFFSLLRTACDDMGLNCGCIGYDEFSQPSAFTKILADMLE